MERLGLLILFILIIIALGTPILSFARENQPDVVEQLKLTPGNEEANDIKALKTELLIRKAEDQALEQLHVLLKKHRGQAMEVELLFRLGELHMRRAKTDRFFELHRENETVAKLAPRKVKSASQEREIRAAINTYEKMRKRFPRYAQIDLVLFNNAFARQLLGHEKSAEEIYWELIRKHQGSSLIPDAHLAIGEINFERRNYKFALEHFLMIEKYPRARAYSYGMYKAAWSYYNLRENLSAIQKLEEVVKHGQFVADNKLDARMDLRREALKDMALFYGEVYPAEKAVSYFVKQSRELDSSPFIMTLVGYYKRHSRHAEVEKVLKDLIKTLPDSEMIASAHDELVNVYETMLDRKKAVTHLQVFSKFCDGLNKTTWKPEEEVQKAKWTGCRDLVAETSGRLAAKWHRSWQKNNKLEMFGTAAEAAYQIYIHQGTQETPEMATAHFNYGELLFQTQKYRDAVKHYAAVRLQKPDNQLRHNAEYAAIVSLEKAVNDKWDDKDEAQFKELAGYYLADNPKGEYALDLRFKQAFIAYRKGRYEEAKPQLKELAWGHSGTDKGRQAQDLYLDILNLQKNYTELKTAAKDLLGLVGKTDRFAGIQKIYREAYFAEVQQTEETGNHANAVKEYLKFASENKDSPLAPQAWWNASQIYFQTGQYHEGAKTCEGLERTFPKSDKVKDCLIQSAKAYEDMGLLEEASRVLTNLSQLDKEKEKQWRELAADFAALSGRTTPAAKIYEELARQSAPADEARILNKWLMLVGAGSAQGKQLRRKLIDLNIPDYSMPLIVEDVESSYKAGKYSEAFEAAKKVIGDSKAANRYKARARFFQAQVLKKEYMEQGTNARLDRIALVLAIKTEKLEKAQRAYEATIRFGDAATSTYSLKHLSEMYLDYAASLRGMRLPASVSDEERDGFRQELESLALPMEEKGIDTLAQAVKAAQKARLMDGTAAEYKAQLDKVNMKQIKLPSVKADLPNVHLPVWKGIGS